MVPELPDIKAEIKAEDFCSSVGTSTPPVTAHTAVTPGTQESMPDSITSGTAAPPLGAPHHLDHHLTQPDPACNWVGTICLDFDGSPLALDDSVIGSRF